MKRCVVVTGSSRGIGLGIAKAFAACGDKVVLNGRVDSAQLSNSVAALQAAFGATTGAEIIGICGDLSDYDTCEAFFRQVEAKFGACEVLVNNAGMAHFGLFTEMTPQQISQVMQHNLGTVFHCCHLATPAMVRAGIGNIINISSIWGNVGASCEAVYSASKAGINGFTKALAKELGPSGVRVNAIACGAFNTRMNDRLDADEKNAFAQDIALGRFGEIHEAGGVAVFLASEAASYLTGQIIGVDGGV